MKRIQIVTLVLLGGVLLSACDPKVETMGYYNAEDWKKNIVVGKTTKGDVINELGSPSALSSFGDETWYYISSRRETYAFLAPELVEQNVTRIVFDASGVVASVEHFDQNSSRDFDIVKRTTPTEGHTLGFVEQVLGNIGRFNKPGGSRPSTSTRPPGSY